MRKAPQYGADALIFDLEDAVPEAHRTEARRLVREVTRELGGQGQTIFARTNGVDTGQTGDDLEAVVCPELHGVLVPKVAGPEDVIAVSALLDHFERRQGVPQGHTLINPLLETAEAVRLAYDVGKASPRVAYLGYGTAKDGDGARSIGYSWTQGGLETLHLRSRVLADARAAGIEHPVSGLWPAVGELAGLRAFAQQTRDLGYTGMMCIHPSHVPVINEVFSPSRQQIDEWTDIVQRLAEAEAKGTTAIQHSGFLVDTAMVKVALERLEMARRLGLVVEREPERRPPGA